MARDVFVMVLLVAIATGSCKSSSPDIDQPVGISTTRAVRTERPPVAPPPPDAPECVMPSFVFDTGSALVSSSQDAELQRVAACLNTGALRKVSLIVVGHSDATGGGTENIVLALSRAAKIREFLIAHRVAETRILATAAGERATAASVPGRRVDLIPVPSLPAAPRSE